MNSAQTKKINPVRSNPPEANADLLKANRTSNGIKLNKKVFAIQLGFLLGIPILIGFPYMYITLNMNTEQFWWFVFAHIWEAIFFGFFLIGLPLIWLRPINKFLKRYEQKEVINREEAAQIQNFALKYPLKVVAIIFVLVFIVGYPIGILQFIIFPKMHFIEALKVTIMGLVSGILYCLFSYFMLEKILEPIVRITEKLGSPLKKIKKVSIFYKIFVVSLSLVFFSLIFLGTLGYSKARLAVEKHAKTAGGYELELLIEKIEKYNGNFTINMLKEARVGESGYVFITDNNGQIISDHPLNYQTIDEEKNLKEVKEKILKGEKGSYTDVVSTNLFAFVPYDDWRLVSVIGKEEFVKDINQIVVMSFSIAAVALIFSFLLSWLFARSISRPIKKLAEVTDLVAEKGDLNQRVYMRPNDELGLLAESLDKMILKMKQSQEELKKINFELEKRIKERLGPYDDKIKKLEEQVYEMEKVRDNLTKKLKKYM